MVSDRNEVAGWLAVRIDSGRRGIGNFVGVVFPFIIIPSVDDMSHSMPCRGDFPAVSIAQRMAFSGDRA